MSQIETTLPIQKDDGMSQSDKSKTIAAQVGNQFYIVKWTALIVLGCVAEFFGRVIWYLIDSYKIIPAALGILAACLVLYGYITITRSRAEQNTMKRRDGIMLVIMGICMLACFGIFRTMMPLIFG